MPIRLSQRATRTHDAPISQIMARAIDYPHLVSLAAGFVDAASLPNQRVQQALTQLIEDQPLPDVLQYNSTRGYLPLRQLLLERFQRQEPTAADLDPDQLVLTAGSNQLLHLVSEATLDPGDIVLCSAPTYFVYLGQLESLGARPIGIACDDEGITPEALTAQLEQLLADRLRSRIKLLYLVSYCDNPRGVSLTNQRRQDLMQVLAQFDLLDSILVVDDMAYRDLQLDHSLKDSTTEQPVVTPYSLRHHDPSGGKATVVAGTFSKSFAPGIRVGWGILPRSLIDKVLALKGNIDFGSPAMNQHLMHRVLQLGWFDQQVDELRVTYRHKLRTTLDALEASLADIPGVRWITPSGGLYVWLELPNTVATGPAGTLLERAIRKGVLYVPGEYCYPPEGVPAGRNTIRLSFGVPTCQQIEQGVSALAQAIREELKQHG